MPFSRRYRVASDDSSPRWAIKVIRCLEASRSARFRVRIRLPAVEG